MQAAENITFNIIHAAKQLFDVISTEHSKVQAIVVKPDELSFVLI